MLGTQFLKNRQSFQWRKAFGPFFVCIIKWTKPQKQLIRVHKVLRQTLWKLQGHFLGPKRLLGTQVFEKKRQYFQWRKDLGQSFLVISSMKNLWEQIIRSHKFFWQLLWKLQGHFSRTKRLLTTQIFGRKGNLSSEEKFLGHSSFFLTSVTNLREQIIRVHKVFWQWLWKLQDPFFGI